ncbi:MAG: transketolase family protein [Thermoplasmata archaeon]
MQLMNSRDAYGKTLLELGKENQNIVVLDADLSSSTKTCMFANVFPKRFFNIGIAEQNMMGIAAGLATTGKIVFVSTFAAFATCRTYDQIRQSIAATQLNVKIVATHGGITVGGDGMSHQVTEDVGIMRILPNFKVIVPADANQTEKVIRAIVNIPGPAYVRIGRGDTPAIYSRESPYEVGKANILNDGGDVTIIAAGSMVAPSLLASDMLAKEAISAKVIDMHTIKPIDKDAIVSSAKETGAIITAEEHNIIGGLGSAVAEVVCENYPVPLTRVGLQDTFGESGNPGELNEKYGLTSENIVEAARKILQRRRKV